MTSRPLTVAVLTAVLFATWTAVERMQGFNAKVLVAGIGVTVFVCWLIFVRIALNRAAQD